MCCFVTALLLIGPRLTILAWWFLNTPYFNLAFGALQESLSLALPLWVWPVLGIIFLPWTTLAYLIVFPGGIAGLDWLWLGWGC
jgi:hypothetical protein